MGLIVPLPGCTSPIAGSAPRTGWLTGGDGESGAGLQLICVPYLGGGPQTFQGWSEGLRCIANILTIQFPGTGSGLVEVPLTSIRAIAGGIASAIATEVTGPYALMGYSMGALVAFEATRFIAGDRQRPPAALIVAASAAPQRPWPSSAGFGGAG